MILRRFGRAASCGLAFLLGSLSAQAGSFQVNPVRVALSADRPVASLTVSNSGEQPAVVQLQAQRWTQLAGEDAFTDTTEILATPPILTVPAGESRVIRVGMRQRPDPAIEASYRLFLQEVPPAPAPGFQGLQVALRLSVPVFVAPAEAAPLALDWRATTHGEGLELGLANQGNTHVQVVSLELVRADGAPLVAARSVSDYLLPGQARRWLMKTDTPVAPGTRVRVNARTDAGERSADVVVESP